MTLRVTLKDLFICPISYEEMRQPVMNSLCGHTYEKIQIEGWMASQTSGGRVADCPQCRAPIGQLTTNFLVQQALAVLQSPDNSLIGRVEDLADDEERDQVQRAAREISSRRVTDQQNGIPIRLPTPLSFATKVSNVSTACKQLFGCSGTNE